VFIDDKKLGRLKGSGPYNLRAGAVPVLEIIRQVLLIEGDLLMYRKCFATVVAALLAVGGLFAEDIKGIFKKFEDGKVTITVDEKDVDYKVSPDAKQKYKKEEVLVVDVIKKLKAGDKGTYTVEDGSVVKYKRVK
jgi:hypothetical protein